MSQKTSQSVLINIVKVVIVLAILIGLPYWVRRSLEQDSLSGLISDVLIALLFMYPILHFPRKARLPFLFCWAAMEAGSFKLFSSMSRLPSWADLTYLFDARFINNTFSTLSFENFYYELLFGLAVMSLLVHKVVRIQKQKNHFKIGFLYVGFALLALWCHGLFFSDQAGKSIYAQYNPIHWLVKDALNQQTNEQQIAFQDILKQDIDGRRYFKTGRAKNVLIVVLEGLTGSYLSQSREHFDLSNPKTDMPLFSEVAKSGMVMPDFVAHSHQTIRGLYSILCADISKLSWTTPKATLLQNVPEKADLCLPNQLKKNGFATHYLQAADLAFMGKDRFMPLIGFETVRGKDWFEGEGLDKSHWGVDDQKFFQATMAYIEELQKTKKPWMLTVLTVGTHQPYEVTDEYAAKFENKKQASVVFLDSVIAQFLTDLKSKGILKDTLVIVTADESHGSEYGDWASSWVPAVVFAPEQKKLPALNTVSYGLFDMTLSVLDYFNKPLPQIPGRSFFRKYITQRAMVSFTAGRLRWLDDAGSRVECIPNDKCQICDTNSLLGTAECKVDSSLDLSYWMQKSKWLDQNLNRLSKVQTLKFASGKTQVIKHGWQDQWTDNLIGAQYLDFDENTETHVYLKYKILKAGPEGARLHLFLKQAENDVNEPLPEFPLLQEGEEAEMSFVIQNPKARNNFSFHLVAEMPMELQINDFTVEIKKR